MPHAHVIEDDRLIRELLRRVLEDAGWSVTFSEDGREAVRDVGEAQPDVVVLDVTMPGPDGWTVLEQLRAALGDVRVLMLTGRSTQADVVRSMRAGADDFVPKPLDTKVLIQRLDALLQRPGGGRRLIL